MPRNWQNERSRRMWLQVTMWTLFVASMGFAAVIGHVRSNALVVRLGDVKQVGPVQLRVPRGWKVEDDAENALTLREGGDEAFERHVEIRVDRGSLIEVLGMLLRGNEGEQGKILTAENINVGLFPGKFKVQQYHVPGIEESRFFIYDVIASASIGNGQTLSISMSFLGDANGLSEPKDLVKQMAGTVSVVKPTGLPTTSPAQ